MAASPAAAWRPRGGRVGVAGADRVAAALASLASPHLLNFFSPRKATYISLKVPVGVYDPIKQEKETSRQTDTLKVYELVPLPKVGNPGLLYIEPTAI